jgi:SsrA-binding protein
MSKQNPAIRNICENRRARREYEILDTLEAGLALTGSEVKSLRSGKGQIAEAYVRFRDDEAWLLEAHIPQYPQAGPHNNHETNRPRKLLLKREQLEKWKKRVSERGLTMIPLRMYLNGAWIKIEIGLGRGRKLHDKRAVLKERSDNMDTQRALRRRD